MRILPWVGSEPPSGRVEARNPVLEAFYTGVLLLIFLFIAWFSVYVVYKLYEGQK
jgi:hypothetical protein